MITFDGRVRVPLIPPVDLVRHLADATRDEGELTRLERELDRLGVEHVDIDFDAESVNDDPRRAQACARAFRSAFKVYSELYPQAMLDDDFYGATISHARLADAAAADTFRELVETLGPYRKDLARAVAAATPQALAHALVFSPFVPAERVVELLSDRLPLAHVGPLDIGASDAFLSTLTQAQLRQFMRSDLSLYSDTLAMLAHGDIDLPSPLTCDTLHTALSARKIVDQQWTFTFPDELAGVLDCTIDEMVPRPLLSHREHIDAGDQMELCAGDVSFAKRAKLGLCALVMWGDGQILAEFRRDTIHMDVLACVGEWTLGQIYGPKNAPVDPHVRRRVESHLTKGPS